MRIHRLRLTAIGPFPASHDIDFDALSATGLFLLEGPTGAGKSTLIDAITYGLYGTLGTVENTRLPSNHAPLTEPVIEVTFSTTAGIHRIRRTPQWERPKKRGAGVTTQNATAKLWRLADVSDDGGEPLAATTQEVGAEMQALLGLTREQFLQTVVLPQGRFATFLRAKPEERATVLRDVFGTAIYQQVQEQLTEMARTAKRQITALEGEVRSAMTALSRLLQDDDSAAHALHEAGDVVDADEMIRIADAVVDRAQQSCEESEETLRSAQEAEVEARRILDADTDLERNLARRALLLSQQTRLTGQAADIERDRQRMTKGHKAATVVPSLRSHEGAICSATRARQRIIDACAELDTTADVDLTDVDDTAGLQAVVEDTTSQLGALTDVMRLESGLSERAEDLDADDADLEEARRALETDRAALDTRPVRRERLITDLAALRETATPVPVAEQVVERCRIINQAAQLAEAHAAELEEAHEALGLAAEAATAASAAEHAVRARWISSMAGTLAAGLRDDEPCPVCGATTHPDPAPARPDHATTDDVDDAAQRRQVTDVALQHAHTTVIRIAERLQALRDTAQHTSVCDAVAALVDAEANLDLAQQAVRLIKDAERHIRDFDTDTEAIRQRVAHAEQITATMVERLRRDTATLATDEGRCRAAAGPYESVAARVAHLAVRLTRARTLADARSEHHHAQQRLTDAAAALQEALSSAGFPDADAARAALLGEPESAELRRRIQEHDADLARVSGGLAEEALAELTGNEVVDVTSARESHACHHQQVMAAVAARATATAAHDQRSRARDALVEALGTHRALADAALPVLRMGELAAGGEGNTKSTTLSTYVLLRRFEDVVAGANERLAMMSQGRFSLARIDEREGRARRAGLGLCVRDHHTETDRDPHTLSGGETFYVSLCLALGLADVVTSEAGGVALDSLFIDEGFGSLDAETLDGVLVELSQLQAGGRAVGIVSHVAELKARIPRRIEISQTEAGCSTLVLRT